MRRRVAVLAGACGRAPQVVGATAAQRVAGTLDTSTVARAADTTLTPAPQESAGSYTGHDARGIPRYDARAFSGEERDALLRVFGVEDPALLYVSDSTDSGILKYDTKRKTCARCYVNSYRIGFVSLRRPGESWRALERRVHTMHASDFPGWARVEDTSTSDLDPTIRADVSALLADAARAGFTLRVAATYRSAEREAFLMAMGHGRTHTLTSMHSYGRAIDILVDDGNPGRARTRADWIRLMCAPVPNPGRKSRTGPVPPQSSTSSLAPFTVMNRSWCGEESAVSVTGNVFDSVFWPSAVRATVAARATIANSTQQQRIAAHSDNRGRDARSTLQAYNIRRMAAAGSKIYENHRVVWLSSNLRAVGSVTCNSTLHATPATT